MLYDLLGEGMEGNENLSSEEDANSIYKERMNGLVDHIKYLLTFPDNEDVENKNETDEDDENKTQPEKPELDEYELLCKVCEAEAGGSSESEIGHVASVILNRVQSSRFPNTISGVVYEPNQFTSVMKEGFDEIVPSEKTKRAVDSILTSGDTTGGALYFKTEKAAKKSGWPTNKNETHERLEYLFTDPNTHVFLKDKGLEPGVIKKDSYIVAIDAGHGESAPSNYYTTGTAATYNGVYYTEWEWNRQVADMVYQMLQSEPKISPIRIGNTVSNPKMPNNERVPMAIKAGADLYVSIHFNSAGSTSARGSEVVINSGDDQVTKNFAQIMSDSIYDSLGYEALGVKKRKINDSSTWSIVWKRSRSGFPGVITEGCFMSNSEDMKLMVEDAGLQKYATGIVNGIKKYLGV